MNAKELDIWALNPPFHIFLERAFTERDDYFEQIPNTCLSYISFSKHHRKNKKNKKIKTKNKQKQNKQTKKKLKTKKNPKKTKTKTPPKKNQKQKLTNTKKTCLLEIFVTK